MFKYSFLFIFPIMFVMTLSMPLPNSEAHQDSLFQIVEGLESFQHPQTHLSPSHFGHPGYQTLAFVYDKAVDAMVFNAVGKKQQAKEILNYFAKKLRIPGREIQRFADVHGSWGVMKIYEGFQKGKARAFVNALDVSVNTLSGQASMEYYITPGPIAFLAMAFLQVDSQEYRDEAIQMGEVLLLMQRDDGAIVDGDRNPDIVYTEPHMNSLSVFLMLYDLTKESRWKIAAEQAWLWFQKNLYDEQNGVIDQGMIQERPTQVFATDAYSWTMAGPAGDAMSLKALEKLTQTMLQKSLGKIALELPDGKKHILILSDFTDALDEKTIKAREGAHPLGSIEWSAGVVLALQKNAVRFWQEGSEPNRQKAAFYKQIAEYLMANILDGFYSLKNRKGLVSFYATGQWVATGHGWKTPYYYVKDPKGNVVIASGSSIASWIVLSASYQNPFILNDDYGSVYQEIDMSLWSEQEAYDYLENIVRNKTWKEPIVQSMSDELDAQHTLSQYNQKMFLAFQAGDYLQMQDWANQVVSNQQWLHLAYEQQQHKERDIGKLVDYPWGKKPSEAVDAVSMIWKYPLLNEVGAAMWGMIVSSFLLDQKDVAEYWMKEMIHKASLHQIFAPDGPGYWNALEAWARNPLGSSLDAKIGDLYRKVLRQ